MNSSTDSVPDADRIPVGYIIRAHGIRGDVLVAPITDNPERFVKGASVFLQDRAGPVSITAVRHHNDGVILSLDGLSDRNAAEAVRKTTLTIDPADRRALDTDEFWPDQLVGLAAITTAGDVLGTITDVILGAAQDRLVVSTPAGANVEVPFVAALVDQPHEGTVVMRPPEGLFASDHP